MEKLVNDFSVGLFFWQTLLFLVLLFLLRKYAWKPILKAVNDRESSIEDALNSAARAREEMEQLKSDNQKILNEARAERDNILKEAREIKESIIAEAREKAGTEANKIIEQAQEQIENQKMAAITELKNQVAEMSIQIAEKILRDELGNQEKQSALVQEQLKDFKLN
ncbi:MAG TPA: ATP synthase F0 subunit B [Cryomorphaceae bacterium]|nr:ATP synthase F0 subunit B [Owenweeksia sp.]MBF97597.1 ATP synthase F0 subunit B [Owenweeksia sp.]HAD96541.1 ATP synthase F0 subunit B [Cryomorphaceae bacterium]HBF20656.1 F0F1 ATP synthase subunit B [Cryomorphaceae bacterium]